MRRHQHPANPHSPSPQQPPPPVYDWNRFGRHRLRASAGALIDSPLSHHTPTWVGSLWPHPEHTSWERMFWHVDTTHGCGWLLPARLAGGDVIEFGGDHDEQIVRWYGIIDSYDAIEWLTIQGPYPDPTAALDDAQRLLANLRYQAPLSIAPTHRTCTRTRQPRFH